MTSRRNNCCVVHFSTVINWSVIVLTGIISLFCWGTLGAIPCARRDFSHGSVVCVCNASYCDTVDPVTSLTAGHYVVYQSSKAGDRFAKTTGQFTKGKLEVNSASSVVLTINRSKTYQTMNGFGGAFTDAAGINILNVSVKTRTNLMNSYFSPEGLEYSIGRIPMASCDFSTHPYSYDDTAMDFSLSNFSLTKEDTKFKIPLIQQAQAMNHRKMKFFGSPWSAPSWMKTNKNMKGRGSLMGQPGGKYFKTWAQYFVRFIQEYQKQNITMWGITAQNEPSDGEIIDFPFQAMGWTADLQRDFIKTDLGPALQAAGFASVKLMILDDNRIWLPLWAKTVLSDPVAAKYVSGIGVHWYLDTEWLVPASLLTDTHNLFPDKFILATEACAGSMPWQTKVILGSWDRAESYSRDIIEDISNWASGWTDWNLALNMQGGPNWVKNFVDSPIIVNAERDEFYKQPMFYVMGHFSKFVPPDSVRIDLTSSDKSILAVAFTAPDKSTVLVTSNRQNQDVTVVVKDSAVGTMTITLPRHSIQTFVWWT
ncbi:glucosylceramidase [Lingula anatina]|uniref:Glucosylceramidase n=1 Tax=Lingula anatina TaxID=7574 RepID=A0A1S3HF23_LINAN|nr:glucosylceramidase [Lingula anatina]|eukprot:XP_013384673.1 glucosylceramidase [Lingula anatina]